MAKSKAMAADPEVSAIHTVLAALDPLSPEARERVIGFVFHRLGVSWSGAPLSGASGRSRTEPTTVSLPLSRSGEPRPSDIRSLREQKRPRSAIEMATLVAYYLENLAPLGERKSEFSGSDLVRYFKQAAFPLPKSSLMTLVHTRNAGYIDGAGRGLYRINPVGHNLVAHALPREGQPAMLAVESRGTRKPRARR